MRVSFSVLITKTLFIISILNIDNRNAQTDDFTLCGTRKNKARTDFIFTENESRNPPGLWPWVVSMGEKLSSKNIWEHSCGGSLVTPELVLTAAHCARDLAKKIKQGKIFIRAGDDHLQDATDDANVEVVKVDDFEIHPNFTGYRYYDIAFLKLSRPITLSPYIRTVCLPSEYSLREDDDRNSLTVTGWGKDIEDQSGKSLFDTRVQVHSEASCNSEYEGERNSEEAVPDGFTGDLLCGSDPSQKDGVCHGDSGSPAVFHRITEKNYVLKAVVSGGITCGTEEHPNIYVRVSDYSILSWIYQQINKEVLLNKTLSGYPKTNNNCVTTGESPNVGTKCVFPLQYKGQTYHECAYGNVTTSLADNERWCSTRVHPNGTHVRGQGEWGFCSPACFLLKEIIYIVGGYKTVKTLNTVETFDPLLNKWSELPPMGTPREAPAVAVLDNELYVIGGNFNEDGVALNTAEKWDPVSEKWSNISNLKKRRFGAVAEVMAGNLFVIGGHDYTQVSASVEMFVNDRWDIVSIMPMLHEGAGAVELDGKLYVIGGHDVEYDDYSLVIVFDGISWRFMESRPGHPGEGPGVAALDGKIYAAGGKIIGSVSSRSVDVFDPVKNEWSFVTDMNVGRFSPALVSQGGNLWAFGGKGSTDDTGHGGYSDLSSVEMYDPLIDKWILIGDMKSCAGFVGAGVLLV